MSLLLHIIVTYIKANVITKLQKSHTNKEGGAHLRISSWHLSMNFKNLKKQNFEKWKKKCWRYHFSHVYQKPQSYEVQFLRYSILGHFLPFYPSPPNKKRKPKFWKEENSICKYHHFKLVQQETQSYDICLLRYGVWQI